VRTYVRIRRSALIHNYREIRRAVGPKVAILNVIKADAYGHGAVEVASALVSAGAKRFAVADVPEGIELRKAGVEAQIVVLDGVEHGEESCARVHGLTPVIHTFEDLQRWRREAVRAQAELPYHAEIDSGMTRLGLPSHKPGELAEALAAAQGLRLEGIFTHLASAEDFLLCQTTSQRERFRAAAEAVRAHGLRPRFVHVSNSAAVAYRPDLDADMVRPGLALYGYVTPAIGDPPALRIRPKPILEWKSRIVAVRGVQAGDRLGYNATFEAKTPMRAAVLGVGYADGLDRRLSNGGQVLIRGTRCPIVGLISMDLTLVDVTSVPGVQAGEKATLIGPGLDADEMARACGSIPYEALCGISRRVPRVYCD